MTERLQHTGFFHHSLGLFACCDAPAAVGGCKPAQASIAATYIGCSNCCLLLQALLSKLQCALRMFLTTASTQLGRSHCKVWVSTSSFQPIHLIASHLAEQQQQQQQRCLWRLEQLPLVIKQAVLCAAGQLPVRASCI